MQQLRNINGQVILQAGDPAAMGAPMIIWLQKRCQSQGHKVVWGHSQRVMKRRTDPENLVMKCKTCGDHVVDV